MYSIVGADQIAAMLGMSMTAFVIFAVLISVWTVILKGFALWFSARNSQKWWFIALLVLNTFGIVEAMYLLFFRPKKASGMDGAPRMM